jgi:hypothetical protein
VTAHVIHGCTPSGDTIIAKDRTGLRLEILRRVDQPTAYYLALESRLVSPSAGCFVHVEEHLAYVT